MRFSILANRIMVLLLFQPIRFKYVSFDIKLWKRAKVVKSFGNFFTDEHYHACCRSHAFDLHTTVTVQNFTFFGCDWHLTQKYSSDNCSTWTNYSGNISLYQGSLFHSIDFIRRPVALSGETKPLDEFAQAGCHFIRETWSTWLVWSDDITQTTF